MAGQQFARNTNGTTLDGVLDALVALINILNQVYSAQLQTVGAGTDGNQMTAQVAAGIDATKAAVAAGTSSAATIADAQKTRDDALLTEVKKIAPLLTSIDAQLRKGLLVKTVASL